MKEKEEGYFLIALAELNISWENKEENKKKCRKMAKEAARNHANLLIFPEMTLTGFSMNIEKIAEERENSKTLKFFQELSKEYKLAIAFGMAEIVIGGKQLNKAVNKCYLISKGDILLEYAKLHPFTYGKEANYYQGGRELAMGELSHVRLAPLICYDLRFPEPFQILSAQADFIFIIANWPLERIEHWDILLKARAIENQCYIAGINRCGKDLEHNFPMSSLIYDPYGHKVETQQEIKDKENGNLYLAGIDKEVVQKYRQEFPLKKDRQEELYLSLKKSITK